MYIHNLFKKVKTTHNTDDFDLRRIFAVIELDYDHLIHCLRWSHNLAAGMYKITDPFSSTLQKKKK